MYAIQARNVCEAWDHFRMLFQQAESTRFREVSPRGRKTLEHTGPVVTQYWRPEECVLHDPVRDANPFFHLYEALWMLAGRNDVARLAYYTPQIKAYSDDDKTFNGAYGNRWRVYFGQDQLQSIVEQLKKDPESRRAVLTMWNPTDLWVNSKDVPCNTQAYFKIRDGALNMTVLNRSNDAVWGCYGANAVQFSFLQQYIARQLMVEVGSYVQFSDSLHVYVDGKEGEVWDRCIKNGGTDRRNPVGLLNDYSPGNFRTPHKYWPHDFSLEEAEGFTQHPGGLPSLVTPMNQRSSQWLFKVAYPVLRAFQVYKEANAREAFQFLVREARADDAWVVAAVAWMRRRAIKAMTEGR